MPGPDLEPATLILLIVAAFSAGWVDAVVGGGGLIQLPALLIALPATTSPATILGTNKVSSVWGTATSSITYAVKIKPDWRTVLPLVLGSAVGSALGAQAAKLLPRECYTDRPGRLGGGGHLHLAPAPAGSDVGAQARRTSTLRSYDADRSHCRGLRRLSAPARVLLRDLVGGCAGLRVPRGQRQGQDRQSHDESGVRSSSSA